MVASSFLSKSTSSSRSVIRRHLVTNSKSRSFPPIPSSAARFAHQTREHTAPGEVATREAALRACPEHHLHWVDSRAYKGSSFGRHIGRGLSSSTHTSTVTNSLNSGNSLGFFARRALELNSQQAAQQSGLSQTLTRTMSSSSQDNSHSDILSPSSDIKGPLGKSILDKIVTEFSPSNILFLEIIDGSAGHRGHAGVKHMDRNAETHFSVRLVTKEFEGMGRVKRHQRVMGLLKKEFDVDGLHALELWLKTPEEGAGKY